MAWEKFQFAETETVLPAKIIIIDEVAEFVEQADRKLMSKVDKFQENIASIARLGRSAHIHLVMATQSASANIFPSSLKNNIAQRFIAGHVTAQISRMAIDTEEGESIPSSPGSYLGYSDGETLMFQGWFTKTKDVLSYGTVKEDYNAVTGLPEGGDSYDISHVEEENSEPQEISNLPIAEDKKEKPAQKFILQDVDEHKDELEDTPQQVQEEHEIHDDISNSIEQLSEKDLKFEFDEKDFETEKSSANDEPEKKTPKKMKIKLKTSKSIKLRTGQTIKRPKGGSISIIQ